MSETTLHEWRARVLNFMLPVLTLVGLPAIFIPIWNGIKNPDTLPSALGFALFYISFFTLAFFRRLGNQVRAWGFLTLVYGVSLLALYRLGLAGDGRIMLMLLPVLAIVLLGNRAGLMVTGLCIATGLAFSALGQMGVLEQWFIEQDNPASALPWLRSTATMTATWAVGVVLLIQYNLFQRKTLAAERKLAEELAETHALLAEYNQTLEQMVEQRTAELEQAMREAQEASEAKSAFLANVSHELRTPLTSVLGFAKIIKKRLDDVIFPELGEVLDKVQRAVKQVSNNIDIIIAEGERLTSLINDVLDLAKIEAGKIEWHIEPVLVQDVIRRAVNATASLFVEKPVELIVEVDETLPRIRGDNDRLIQVMVNLISNAAKFTHKGTVTCRAQQAGDQMIVSVIDTGIGIAPEHFEDVFEEFVQVGDTLTDKPTGTGLGLPICKQIVEYHGGQIWVDSEPDKGSTFFFTIPVANYAHAPE